MVVSFDPMMAQGWGGVEWCIVLQDAAAGAALNSKWFILGHPCCKLPHLLTLTTDCGNATPRRPRTSNKNLRIRFPKAPKKSSVGGGDFITFTLSHALSPPRLSSAPLLPHGSRGVLALAVGFPSRERGGRDPGGIV